MKAVLIALALITLYAFPAAAQDADRNCPDFASQAEAQRYFEENGGSAMNNVDDLDRNKNGVACEDHGGYSDPARDETAAIEDTATNTDTKPDVPTTEEDAQDDQQGEMPDDMGDTGAGGLASGTTIPVGNAAAACTVLLGAGYAVLRRR